VAIRGRRLFVGAYRSKIGGKYVVVPSLGVAAGYLAR
jgi:hypothetical protein